MRPIATITPAMLVMLAAEWSDAELRAAAAVLADLVHDRDGAVPQLKPEVLAGTKGDAAA